MQRAPGHAPDNAPHVSQHTFRPGNGIAILRQHWKSAMENQGHGQPTSLTTNEFELKTLWIPINDFEKPTKITMEKQGKGNF